MFLHDSSPNIQPNDISRLIYGDTADSGVEELCKVPGTIFDTSKLVQSIDDDPIAATEGSVYIQTEGLIGERKRYFFDEKYAIDPERIWLVAHIRDFLKANPSNTITIGQPWESPFGKTDPVEAIAVPYTDAHDVADPTMERMNLDRPLTAYGRSIITAATLFK